MKIWFDTEFIEDGRTIDLISIGLVNENGRTFYAESSGVDLTRANDWVKANVIPHLAGPAARMPRKQIADRILEFANTGGPPEFWAYYADYDWVALCQLYGRMVDLPIGWPMYCRDIKQLADMKGVSTSTFPKPKMEHHALADALWNKKVWEYLSDDARLGLSPQRDE